VLRNPKYVTAALDTGVIGLDVRRLRRAVDAHVALRVAVYVYVVRRKELTHDAIANGFGAEGVLEL